METILIRPNSKEQIKVFEQMAKALKVPFEIKKESPYNPEFVAMVKQADKDFKNGKGKKMKLDEIWK
jgi:restriction endonuclease